MNKEIVASTDEYTFKLVHQDSHEPVMVGEICQGINGVSHAIRGGSPPKHGASTGRVYVDGDEYFPAVFGLLWVRVLRAGN